MSKKIEYKTKIYDIEEYGRCIDINQINFYDDAFKHAKEDIERCFICYFINERNVTYNYEDYVNWVDEFMDVHMPTFSKWFGFQPKKKTVRLHRILNCEPHSEEFILNGERAKFHVTEL